MGRLIDADESIKELSKWRKGFNYDNGDYCYGDDTTRYSLDIAIDTMRKYQKIEEIVKEWSESGLLQDKFYDLINEVLEDGNDEQRGNT